MNRGCEGPEENERTNHFLGQEFSLLQMLNVGLQREH